jgi:hypothetical protein
MNFTMLNKEIPMIEPISFVPIIELSFDKIYGIPIEPIKHPIKAGMLTEITDFISL